MADIIEELLQKMRDQGDLPRVAVTLITVVGLVLVLVYLLKLLYSLFNGFRLYILNQFCFKTDYIKKYGKWALITGATDGIGQAMAKELAQRGHSIIIVGRNKDKLSHTKATLEAEPNVGEVVAIKIDLSDSSVQNFEKIRSKIDAENRDIGILMNNAGTTVGFKTFTRVSQDESKTMINVNILSHIYITRLVLPSMIKRKKGLICLVSSLLSCIPSASDNNYGATKKFLNAFGELLRYELEDYPIDVVTLQPGPVRTKLFTDHVKLNKSNIAFPTPEDYAKSAINALASPIPEISGTMTHGILRKFFLLTNKVHLTYPLYKFSAKHLARNYDSTQVEGDDFTTVAIH